MPAHYNRKKPCPKCLETKEFIEKERLHIQEYVNRIPTEERADDTVYEKRMEECMKCTMRREEICGKCGCYIRIRASKKERTCPHEIPRW